ncbi:hypothetical protein ACQ4PT_034416 [Festuca glaucescens]
MKLLLLLLCGYHSLGAGDAHSISKVLATGSQKAEAVCAEPQVTRSSSSTGSTVPLNHRYGPCSPAPSANAPTIAELLRRDQFRAEYLRRKFTSTGGLQQSEVTIPTNLGTALDTLEYVITVGIGSPAVLQTVLIDTGSDVSWVQCNPCTSPPCHAPAGSLFDPAQSSTYVPFPCSSAPCTQLGDEGNGCSNSQCQYIAKYGDGSNTTGTYGSDTLTLSASETITSFQFGCSHDEEGLVSHQKTDGLMRLGGDVQSLVSQTAATYGSAFSYCLPKTSSTSGFLTLGAPSDTSGFVTTPMLRSQQVPTFYALLLQDIRVGGHLLGIPPSVFAAGSVMDSGTVITRLPPTAYSALSSAFKHGMAQYPQAPPVDPFDTCFDFTGLSNITIPGVALVFDGGAIVNLDFDGIIQGGCLAFAATSDISFIGNVQQRTFEVLYDVGQSIFGFRSGAC